MSSTLPTSIDSTKTKSPSSPDVNGTKKFNAGSPLQTSGILPSIASNLTPVAGLAAWIVNPLRAVGPTAVDLGSMPTGRDYASRSACKSQTFTSWDSLSRSYVASLVYRGVEQEEGHQQPAQGAPDPMVPDVPNAQELAALTQGQRNLYQLGKRRFYRGVGLLTDTQVANPTHQDRIRQRSAHKNDAVSQTTPRNEYVVRKGRPPKGSKSVKSVTYNKSTTRSERKKRSGDSNAEVDKVTNTFASLTSDLSQSKSPPQQNNTPAPHDLISAGSSKQPTADGPPEQVLQEATGSQENQQSQGVQSPEESEDDENEYVIEGFEDDDDIEWYSDTIPIRCVTVNRNKHALEASLAIPYTPIFNNNLEKLNDPSATTSMASVTRSGTTRDAPSMMSLSKFLRTSTTTVLDVAPLVRLGCIVMSLARECYQSEIIPYRFVRNWETIQYMGVEIAAHRENDFQDFHLTAMPIDVFNSFTFEKCSFEVRDAEGNELFFPDGCDNDWIAIPITQDQLKDTSTIAYIASFLHSDLFAGRVNHVFRGRYTDTEAQYAPKTMAMRLMPCCNSVSIPGPKNAILVLIDCTSTSHPPSVDFGHNLDIPVFVDRAHTHAESFAEAWNDWFSNDNINEIADGARRAFSWSDKHLAVENTSNIALSVIAELYGALYNGMFVQPRNDSPTYDWQQPAGGAWSMFRGNHLAINSRVITEYWDELPEAEAMARRRMVGYNFSGLTTWHLPPTGMTLTDAHDASIYPNTGHVVRWSALLGQTRIRPNYTIPSMESRVRICTAMELIAVHEKTTTFLSARGMQCHIHMLSAALAAQAATIFSATNISLACWSGYDTRGDSGFTTEAHQKLIPMATNAIASYTNLPQMMRSWNGWDFDMMSEYFGIDPFDNPNWLSCSPLPFHFVQQWAQKISLQSGEYPGGERLIPHNATNHYALVLTDKSLQYRSKAISTIDADRYLPLAVFRDTTGAAQHLYAWVDQWSYVSNAASGVSNVLDRTFLESQEFVLSVIDNGIPTDHPNLLYVVGSTCSQQTEKYRDVSVSDLVWPDPIDIKDIISAAKNYLVYPGLSALGGYVTGGPVGALVAGGTHLAKTIISEQLEPKDQAKAISAVTKIGKVVEDAYGKTHTVQTHASEKKEKEEPTPAVAPSSAEVIAAAETK